MRTKEVAEALVPLVNHKKSYEGLKRYAQERIEMHHKVLESADSIEHVKQVQGAIEELGRLLNLYERVEAKVKGGKV